MKEGPAPDTRQVEDEFRAFLLLLSDFQGWSCAIAKRNAFPRYLYRFLYLWLTRSISVLFHCSVANRLAMSMKTAPPPSHDGPEILRTLTVWGSDAHFAN